MKSLTARLRGAASRSNSPLSNRVDFWFFIQREDGKTDCGMPLTMEILPEFSLDPPPTLSMQPDEVQMLMDSLWSCGFRPTEGTGSAGALAAVERHLKDLQRIVFDRKPE